MIKTRKYDVADHLRTRAERIAYLKAVVEEGDWRLLIRAVGNVLRSYVRG